MVYTPSGRLIKYLFSSKGVKKEDTFLSPSVARFYEKLYKAKEILENARPTRDYERKFMLAMDKLDELLCAIERVEKYTPMTGEEIAREALRRKLAKVNYGRLKNES